MDQFHSIHQFIAPQRTPTNYTKYIPPKRKLLLLPLNSILRAMEHEALALNSADNVARGMYRLSIERIDTQLDTWRKEYMWQPLLL